MEAPPPPQNSKDNIFDEQNFESIEIDSDLLLSKIQFDEIAPESPQINYSKTQGKINSSPETQVPTIFKKFKPYCGCGIFYSCTSSLYLHIRTKHGGKPLPGTIGGPKGIVKKPSNFPTDPAVKVEQQANPSYSMFPNNQQKSVSPQVADAKTVPESSPQDQYLKNPVQIKKKCPICNKRYSCNSSLNLHLKRKHQYVKDSNGRTEISYRQQEQNSRGFECTQCGLNYASKSALGLHFNSKHSSKGQNDEKMPYDENKVQKCGCGLVYQSRSALNMHVKKKHDGIYPDGTTEKANTRFHHSYNKEDKGGNRIEGYLVGSHDDSDEEQHHSIYDSDSENGQGQKEREKPQKKTEKPKEDQKIFRCGCGRNYSCSSSLNLHIKKNHNGVIQEGTIGGPRGLRFVNQNRQQQPKPVEKAPDVMHCEKCKEKVKGSYFQCTKCEKAHQKCSTCFWQEDNYSKEHQWSVQGVKGN